ncbi:MAG: class I SAM-dependent methyltransferase [Acidobacteria bacterium]|nr:class I SAM-dependent methyltransferase [Acidobacteriota bacterium]
MTTQELAAKMRDDWDARAQSNAKFYVADSRQDWTDEEFYAIGRQTVADDIQTDMYNVCQGSDPKEMRVLEIGCGAGRVTRALAEVFGAVDAVDISPAMVALARQACTGQPNASIWNNNGVDLSVIPGEALFDFAFSICVFHHIPSRGVIESYVKEVGRLLKPGRLFKFEVQGDTSLQTAPDDTWLGVPFSEEQVRSMAARCGFEARHLVGLGEERLWIWLFKSSDGPPHCTENRT